MIRIENVYKRFGNNVQALKGLNLNVGKGELFGYIGPNGAGKSTTIRMLATLEYPDRGKVEIAGTDVVAAPEEIRRIIGYMPELFGLYDQMNVVEYLELFARIYGVDLVHIDTIIELTGLAPKRDALCGTLSKGNRQRVYLARILLHDPELLLLDEPASGLDPLARIELRELLKELHRMGKTILISSHILADLEDICDNIGIIEHGTLLVKGRLSELREQLRTDFEISLRVNGSQDSLYSWLALNTQVSDLENITEGLRFRFRGDRDAVHHLLNLALSIAPIYSFDANEGTLEDIFMRFTKGTVS